jgi:hypothetical protein
MVIKIIKYIIIIISIKLIECEIIDIKVINKIII